MVLVDALVRPIAALTLQDIHEQYPPQYGLSEGLLSVAIPIVVLRAAFLTKLEEYLGYRITGSQLVCILLITASV